MDILPKPLVASLALAVSALALPPAHADPLVYLGQQIVETGRQFGGTAVGGLSGIDYNPLTQRHFAISDDRSALNPARFYELSLDLAQFQRSATPGSLGVSFHAVTSIANVDGLPFGTNQVDPEGIRYDAARGQLYWSNEGQRTSAGFQDPTVRSMRLDGSYVSTFAVPTHYKPAGSSGGLNAGDTGIYNNLAFESLTLSRDGKTLWTATENALAQDGPPSSVTHGSRARLLGFDAATGLAGAEYVYDVSPVALPPIFPGLFATNGLADMLAIGDRQFITIERSFAVGAATPGVAATTNGQPTGNTIRLFYADARGATDVSGLTSIAGAAVTAVKKELLLDLSTLKHDDGSALALDNIEGLTLGPVIDGKQTLILVSDNNFGGSQFTQFVALSINAPIPEPQTYALLLAGLALVAGAARRCA
ncbi:MULTISPECIES: esterase-like activity of phytase family protein [unclassified Roseateles]|uniref:esterase-like activity of phytase family protein n=1 Tax=unclassified Roseateles TaxID=2626991 RepID=UPI0009E9C066|nr:MULTISPECIES: esterase-like activity of phytase family protein [unclassified Roseateles]